MGSRSKILITKRIVDQLRPGQCVWDREVRGFHVRMQVQDRVYCLACKIDGVERYITIAKHGSPWTAEMARRKALELLGDVVRGIDPRKKPTASAVTVAELFMRRC